MHQVPTLIPNRIQNFVSSKTDFKNASRSRKRQMMEMILNWNIFGRKETLFVKFNLVLYPCFTIFLKRLFMADEKHLR